MKKTITAFITASFLSAAFATPISAEESAQGFQYPYSFLSQPETVGAVFADSFSASEDYSTSFQYDAIASGSWSGGNGYYSVTVSWGDNKFDYYSGTSKSSSWVHFYPTMKWYDLKMTVTSHGGTDYRNTSLQI